jgi:hypothetical protein
MRRAAIYRLSSINGIKTQKIFFSLGGGWTAFDQPPMPYSSHETIKFVMEYRERKTEFADACGPIAPIIGPTCPIGRIA